MGKSKKLLALILTTFILIASVIGCGSEPTVSEETTDPVTESGVSEDTPEEVAGFTAGTYQATVRGHQDDITVDVTFSDDAITDVTVLSHNESVGIGTFAVDRIPKAILEKQSLGVDSVTGATLTSAAILQAVGDCAEQAGADTTKLRERDPADEPVAGDTIKLDTDVLVIGGGGTGLAASIEATRAGSSVILLESMDFLGGDTGRAGGGIEAAGTKFQEARGINDKPEDFAAFIRSRGVSFRNPELLDTMVNESAASVDFLADMGADMSMQVAGHGSPVDRAHRPAEGPAGQNIVVPMIEEIEKLDVEVYYGTPGYELIQQDGAVVGAKAKNTRSGQEYEITAKSVVIATGNFASNNDMVGEYDSRLKGADTNSSTGSRGDAIVMGTAVGADLENMEVMRVTTALPRSAVNFIAVSQDAKRFMDEYYSSDTIFVDGDDLHIQAVANHTEKHYWVLIDEANFEEQAKVFASYLSPGQYVKADTLEAIAQETNLDLETLKATVETWNEMVANGEDTEFGRTNGMDLPIGDGPYYAFKVRPKVHTTAGGIRITTAGEVLNANEEVIPGLFAGGEVTGGVHDGVSAVCGAIVYGRICGVSAAEHAAS